MNIPLSTIRDLTGWNDELEEFCELELPGFNNIKLHAKSYYLIMLALPFLTGKSFSTTKACTERSRSDTTLAPGASAGEVILTLPLRGQHSAKEKWRSNAVLIPFVYVVPFVFRAFSRPVRESQVYLL